MLHLFPRIHIHTLLHCSEPLPERVVLDDKTTKFIWIGRALQLLLIKRGLELAHRLVLVVDTGFKIMRNYIAKSTTTHPYRFLIS